MIRFALLIAILGISSYFDVKERTIPNRLIYSGLLISLVINIVTKNFSNIKTALIIYLVLRVIYKIDKDIFPGGDIKMLTFIALIGGYDFFVKSLYYIIIFTIPMLIYFFIKEKIKKEKQTIPLAVPMFLSSLCMGVLHIAKIF